jgi:hypothetical protein
MCAFCRHVPITAPDGSVESLPEMSVYCLRFCLIGKPMESVGKHIVEMEELINTPLSPPPSWIRKWQTEAEHILAMAHFAKDKHDIEKLRVLDEEAKKLVEARKAKAKSK